VVLNVKTVGEGLAPLDWTSAGLIVGRMADAERQLLLVPLSARGEPGPPKVLRSGRDIQPFARVSPDGELIAFPARDSGKEQLHVASFVGGAIAGVSLPVSDGEAIEPRWSRDSRRLYFRLQDNRIVSVTIDRKPLAASAPAPVHDLRSLGLDPTVWTILPDERLLGIQMGVGEGDPTAYNVVLNWFGSIRDRLK
jgi:hypothetical protein